MGLGGEGGVVDEAGGADPDGEGGEGGAGDGSGEGGEGLIVDNGDVVDAGVGGLLDELAHVVFKLAGVALALSEVGLGEGEGAVEDGGLGALGGGEVAVA